MMKKPDTCEEKVIPKKREGLKWTEERRKNRKEVKKRYIEAQRKGYPPRSYKHAAISDYFEWRQKNDPKFTTYFEGDTCLWCKTLEEDGLINCLHCGKVFDKKEAEG